MIRRKISATSSRKAAPSGRSRRQCAFFRSRRVFRTGVMVGDPPASPVFFLFNDVHSPVLYKSSQFALVAIRALHLVSNGPFHSLFFILFVLVQSSNFRGDSLGRPRWAIPATKSSWSRSSKRRPPMEKSPLSRAKRSRSRVSGIGRENGLVSFVCFQAISMRKAAAMWACG